MGPIMPKLLHAFFFESCCDDLTLNRRAIQDKKATYTYYEMKIRAEEIAACLYDAGIGKGDIVALMTDRGFDAIAAVYGIMSIGAVYMPVDRSFPIDRIAYMHDIAKCRFILTDDVSRVQGLPQSIMRLDLSAARDKRLTYDPDAVGPEDLAYVLFTSGSTGRPKGVMIRHSSAVARINWIIERFGPEDLALVLGSTSYSFDISILELFAPFGCGGALAIVDSPLSLVDEKQRPNVTLINSAPSALSAVLAVTNLPASVRACILVGEVLHGSLARSLYHQGVARVFNLYGPTEDTIYSTEYLIPPDTGDSVPIGVPLPGTEVIIVDDNLHPVVDGEQGELCLIGVGQAVGYINRPDLTDERFLICGSGPHKGKRMYRTGDRACLLSSGELHCLGRMDSQVKIDGHRIELSEIESVMIALPEVSQAAVIVAEFGHQRPGLAAYIVAAEKEKDNAELIARIQQQISSKLPPYMYPVSYRVLDAFPMTTSGKLDKKALPPPLEKEEENIGDSVSTALKNVLGRTNFPDNVSIFAQGANSLDIVWIVAQLRQLTGKFIAISEVLQCPTPDGLRRLVQRAMQCQTSDSLVAVDPMYITQAQRQMWLAQKMADDPKAYLLFINVVADCTSIELAEALQTIIRRHISLHTEIVLESDRLCRVLISNHSPVQVNDQEIDWNEAVKWHLGDKNPFSVFIFKQPEGVVARIVANHSAFDRWSLSVLRDELVTLLNGKTPASLGQCVAPPHDEESDSDFIRRLADELAFAQTIKWPAVPLSGSTAYVFCCELTASVACQLHATAKKQGLTIASVCFGIFAECASIQTKINELSIGITLADRHLGNLYAIDCHVNTLPLFWSRSFGKTLIERLTMAGQRVFDHFTHSHIGIEPILFEVRQRRKEPNWVPFSLAYGYHSESSAEMSDVVQVAFHPNSFARLPLTLWIEERDSKLYAVWTANSSLFYPREIEEWHQCFLDIITRLPKTQDGGK